MSRPLYEHTQAGWPIRIALLAASVMFVVLSVIPGLSQTPAPPPVIFAGAVAAAVIGWAWSALTVRIQDDELQVGFGLGWPRKKLRVTEISAVEITRTTLLQGWGVHRTRRGWLYNVSGFDAVLLRLADGRSLLVGTDEPRRLKAAIERAQARS